jgi:hypothetical protein
LVADDAAKASAPPPAKRAKLAKVPSRASARDDDEEDEDDGPPARRRKPSESSPPPPSRSAARKPSTDAKKGTRKPSTDSGRDVPFDQIMSGVTFVLSGFENPYRNIVREREREKRRKEERRKAWNDCNCSFALRLECFVCNFFFPPLVQLRTTAQDMGARYSPNWDGRCTHLVCAFKDTPKYIEVKGQLRLFCMRSRADCAYVLLSVPE